VKFEDREAAILVRKPQTFSASTALLKDVIPAGPDTD
jgi:hypothetical protein